MLPRWRDEVRIELAPRRVALTRVGRGLRPKGTLDIGRRVACANVSDWQPAMAALRELLADFPQRGANARIVISDHWTRFAVMPWSDDIAGEQERLAHAGICLAAIYGAPMDGWQVGLGKPVPGQATLVSAIPAALLADTRRALDDLGLRVASIEPQLVAAHNAWRHRLPESGGWFVALDDGSLAAARMVGRGWDRVYVARVGTDWQVELKRLSAFGRLARERSGDRVYVDAPSWLRELAGDCGPDVQWMADLPPEATPVGLAAAARRLFA